MTDLDPDSLALLNLAREARTPSDDDKARVGRRLALALGASAAATATSAASSSVVSAAHAEANATLVKAGSAGVAKWIGGGALLAATVAGYVALSTPAAHVATPRVAPRSAPQPVKVAPTPMPAPTLESPTATQAPAQAETAAPVAPVMEATPHRVARKHHAAQSDSLAAELELLHRAQAAWRARDAASALSLLGEHQSRYPHSQLDVERDALHALALCELGRTDEAARIAHNVIARAPHSPLRASLEQSCALK